jgi:Arc/MetJ family transcription regulator
MRTNIEIDEETMKQAFSVSNFKTKVTTQDLTKLRGYCY